MMESQFIETLIKGKEIEINGAVCYIKIDKYYYCTTNNKDFYYYKCTIYRRGKKFKIIPVNIALFTYNTEWNEYYIFGGNLDKVIDEAKKKYVYNMDANNEVKNEEQKYVLKYLN